MHSRSLLTLLLPLFVLAACAESGTEHGKGSSSTRIGVLTSPSTDPQYRENVRSLDGPQSVELVAGKTVVGRYTDTPGAFFDYVALDGRLVSREPDGKTYRGRWKARYTEFCVEYDDHPRLAHQRCFSFFENDGRYSSFRPGGVGFYDIHSIIAGNVEKLPLE